MGGPLQPGQFFAGYRVVRLLGSGGMGAVYLADHPNLPKQVALKLLSRALTDNPETRARFLREADTAARLDHPNIVSVHDRGAVGDQLWIAMQYVEGSDAAAALRTGPMPPARAVRVVAETAAALDYAHELGVLHRDVKPANILLAKPVGTSPERVLLADFGIAKALDGTGGLTRSGMLLASLQYAAPEQLDAYVALDRRADVYALGCTLYHLLTGALPYPGDTASQLMRGHLSLPVPQPSLVRGPAVPPGFDVVVRRALAKDRDDRYPTCGALAAAALAGLGGGQGAGPQPGWTSTPQPPPQPRQAPAPTYLHPPAPAPTRQAPPPAAARQPPAAPQPQPRPTRQAPPVPAVAAPQFARQPPAVPPPRYARHPPVMPPPRRRSNGSATAALVFGLLALATFLTIVGGLLFGVLAVVFGLLGLVNLLRGRGGAVRVLLGLVLGAASIAGSWLLVPPVVDYLTCASQVGTSQAEIDECGREFTDRVGSIFGFGNW